MPIMIYPKHILFGAVDPKPVKSKYGDRLYVRICACDFVFADVFDGGRLRRFTVTDAGEHWELGAEVAVDPVRGMVLRSAIVTDQERIAEIVRADASGEYVEVEFRELVFEVNDDFVRMVFRGAEMLSMEETIDRLRAMGVSEGRLDGVMDLLAAAPGVSTDPDLNYYLGRRA